MPLLCPVDLDSLCLLLYNGETGPQAEVWDWRSVLYGIARSSRLPELPDSDCQDRFRGVGRTYVLDLSVRGTYSHAKSPGGGIVTMARLPPILYCWVAEMMSNTIAIGRGCTRMRGCAGNRHSPGEIQDVRRVGVSRTGMTCAEDSRNTALCARKEGVRDDGYMRGMTGIPRTEMLCAENLAYIRPDPVVESPVCVWSVTWVTSLRISTWMSTRRGCSGSVVDCSCVFLVPRWCRVVDYYVVQRGFTCGEPIKYRYFYFDPAAGYVFGTRLRLGVR